MPLPTIEKCRSILGKAADGMTDEQIERERDHLAQLANLLFDQFAVESKRDPEAMKRLLDAHRNGVGSDADLESPAHDADEWTTKDGRLL